MGFSSRIQNSLRALLSEPTTPKSGYTSDTRPNNSFPIMATKMAFDAFSQPVWGPEISTAGAYSREGYTSKTFDMPAIPFTTQKNALQYDEDVQLAINDLSSKITGSAHFWKAIDDQVGEYLHKFSKDLHFDIIDTDIVKELLWYGNSVWKPRLGIKYVRSHADLMHIPISSFMRVWWDRQRIPYKYEFRGPEYQGYHNPEDIIHLKWNSINASVFGTGYGVSMTSPRQFEQITPAGPQPARLPSLLDRKYSTQLTMHITERRYIPHNIYVMPDSSADERSAARADLQILMPGEDFVVGTETTVQELGSMQRAFNPQQWSDLTMAPILKALNDFRAKQAGESQHSYANAKTAALLDEIGLSSFPTAVITQLIEFLFKPWYDTHPLYSMGYGGGLIAMPWESCKYELNFGQIEKKDLPADQALAALQAGVSTGAIMDPIEIRDILQDIGLGLRKEYTNDMMNQYHNTNAYPPGFQQQGNNFDTTGADQQGRPMDNKNYTPSQSTPTPRFPPKFDPQPSDPRLNFTEVRKTKASPKPFL